LPNSAVRFFNLIWSAEAASGQVDDLPCLPDDGMLSRIVTALLFTIGKFSIGLYLGRAAGGSPYGAAGSIIAVIVWVYYSAVIFLFGAEFTHVLDSPNGSPGPDMARQA
jgi:uncharacterized BrkB/YihY/UPF0761 family membrane protein